MIDANNVEPGLVSAIIAVYNGEQYLRDAIESIHAQTYEPVETIVVDDGSEDSSAAIADGFEGVTVVRQANAGLPAAHNAGLERARGEFIAFLDCDDIWEQGKTALQLDYLTAHPACDYVVGQHRNVFLGPVPEWFREEHTSGGVAGPLLGASICRRGVFEKVGPFDPAFRQADDTEWFARARDRSAVEGRVSDVVLQRRIHGSNLSSNVATGNTFLLKAMRESIHRKRAKGQDGASTS